MAKTKQKKNAILQKNGTKFSRSRMVKKNSDKKARAHINKLITWMIFNTMAMKIIYLEKFLNSSVYSIYLCFYSFFVLSPKKMSANVPELIVARNPDTDSKDMKFFFSYLYVDDYCYDNFIWIFDILFIFLEFDVLVFYSRNFFYFYFYFYFC